MRGKVAARRNERGTTEHIGYADKTEVAVGTRVQVPADDGSAGETQVPAGVGAEPAQGEHCAQVGDVAARRLHEIPTYGAITFQAQVCPRCETGIAAHIEGAADPRLPGGRRQRERLTDVHCAADSHVRVRGGRCAAADGELAIAGQRAALRDEADIADHGCVAAEGDAVAGIECGRLVHAQLAANADVLAGIDRERLVDVHFATDRNAAGRRGEHSVANYIDLARDCNVLAGREREPALSGKIALVADAARARA